MQDLGYYNGKVAPLNEMTVPMNDRACYFGDGVYDAAYSRRYRIFALEEHIRRFFRNAESIGIRIPMGKQELFALLNELVRKVDTDENFVYFQVSRGTERRRHDYTEREGNLWVMITPRKIDESDGKATCITVEDTRFLHCNIKTLNLLPSVLAAQKAKEAGADEAIFHRGGRVTECSHCNVHILQNGTLITPPADHLILAGVGRAHLMRAAAQFGMEVVERPFSVQEMLLADEIMLTSAGIPCKGVGKIDGVAVGGKDAARLQDIKNYLCEEFNEETR